MGLPHYYMRDGTLNVYETGTVPIVPLNEWQALYEVADRVRQCEPWRTRQKRWRDLREMICCVCFVLRQRASRC